MTAVAEAPPTAQQDVAPAPIRRSSVTPEIDRALPNLVVIGAMKCGTSSFHEYLDAHPAVAMSRPKELDFFLPPPRGSWSKGVEWYAGNFDASSAVRGEASPNYSKWPMYGGVPERMAALLPDTKLIYLVRDPIERIVSHYIHAVSTGRERRSLDDALTDLDHNWYVACSRYTTQARRFLEHYPRDRMLVLAAEDLRDRTAQAMTETYRFLGVDPSFSSPRFGKVRNVTSVRGEPTRFARLLGPVVPRRFLSGIRGLPVIGRSLYTPVAKPRVSDALRARLQEALHDEVTELRALTRPDFGPWSF